MRVLIACEFSGVLRDAFLSLGHEAYSCDILDPETIQLITGRPIHPNHIFADAITTAYDSSHRWDLVVSHPPCTYLTAAQQHLLNKSQDRRLLSDQAAAFALKLFNAPSRYALLENPPGRLSSYPDFPKPQTIPLTAFGDSYARKLTLFRRPNMPPLHWTHSPHQHPTRPHRLTKDQPSPLRPYLRSITTPGLAKAIASQYGSLPV